MQKLPKAYFLSNNGLGDNISSIGAINYLSQYYDLIYFLCKDIHEMNVKMLFENNTSIIIISFNSNNEFQECKTILNDAFKIDKNINIFICGCHKSYSNSIITHPELINSKNNLNIKNYSIDYDFIENFYKDINLDISIYFEYFNICSSENSKKYYEDIKNYKIVFMHTKSSDKELIVKDFIYNFINNDEYIIICANKNFYNEETEKYNLVQNYINLPIQYYIDIIKNCNEIYVIDSCFSCIVYPLNKTNRLKTKNVTIVKR
jgi:hypothetical protein